MLVHTHKRTPTCTHKQHTHVQTNKQHKHMHISLISLIWSDQARDSLLIRALAKTTAIYLQNGNLMVLVCIVLYATAAAEPLYTKYFYFAENKHTYAYFYSISDLL